MVRPDRPLRDSGAAARLAAWGAVTLLAAGSLRAQAFEEVGDVGYRYGVANAGRIRSIAPITSTRIYVGASDGGAWRTVNGGIHWTTPTDFASSLRITTLAAEPSGARVFAATSNPARLLRSFDGLATVTEIVIPQVAFGGDSISKLVVDPAHAKTVYAVTTRGLLRSTDDGDSWGVVLPPDERFVDDMAVLAGTEFWVLATRGGELFRSATGDAGSFAPVALPVPPDGMPPYTLATPVLLLAAVPGVPQQVYIVYNGPNEAIYRSDNFGATPLFQARHPRFLARGAFAASADGTTLYSGEITGGNKSLNRGRDGGLRWDTPFPGPYHPDVHAVATTASPPYVYVGTDGGLWRYHETTGVWTNLNGDLNTMLVYEAYASRGSPEAIVAGTQDNGVIVHRGARWAIAGGADVGDAYLRADDPNLGGAFEIISASGYIQISGDVAGVPPPSLSPLPCPAPTAGSFGLDRSAPRRVCVATGMIRCSDEGGRGPWCLESADIGAGGLEIVDGMHAWVTSLPGHVLRTITGVLGAWFDVTSDLPAGQIVGLDAPEGGDPLRALVLIGSTTTPPVVYETTDGGISWLPRGVAPVTEPVGVVPVFCGFPPCSDTPERGATALSFAVSFASGLRLEVWFVGTDLGLLQSTDGGATWVDAGIPHVQVNDVDTFGDVVTLGTWGRGVFQKVFDTGVLEFEFLAVDPFWRLRHLPLRVPDLWASDVIAQSNDVIQELRWLGRGGRAFRRGDPPFGPHDFRLEPGAPILIRGDDVTGLQAVGVRPPPRPIPLVPGWNPVAILSPALTTASKAIADAAAQGIILGAFVGDGGQQAAGATAQAAPGAAPALQDFTLDPTGGYWVYVCGGGGVWTPGAGGAQAARDLGAANAATAAHSTVVAPTATIQAAGSICPALDATLQSIAAPLAERVGGEILVCVPEQIVLSGNDQITVCDSPPVLETDLRFDNSACHDQPQGRGCAVGITIREVDTGGPGDLTFVYDVRTVGTATVQPNQVCSINAGTTGASFSAGIDQLVDAPAIHLSLAQWSTTLQLDQSGCGAQADPAIAELVAEATEQALAAEIGLRIAGLGPVCTPDVALPDGDADGTPDCTDGCPQDPGKIDPGLCGCGVVDDFDGDGSASCGGDCNDQDGSVWATPGEVLSLLLSHDGANDRTTLSWSPPSAPGAASIVYDVLASQAANDFAGAAQCVEWDDGSDTVAIDVTPVPPGAVLHFVVRAVNGCPSGDGTIGSASDGNERAGRACP